MVVLPSYMYDKLTVGFRHTRVNANMIEHIRLHELRHASSRRGSSRYKPEMVCTPSVAAVQHHLPTTASIKTAGFRVPSRTGLH